jgi:hypothetical protein
MISFWKEDRLLRYPVRYAPNRVSRQDIQPLLDLLCNRDSYIHEHVAYGCGMPNHDVMLSFWDGSERIDILLWTQAGFVDIFRNQVYSGGGAIRGELIDSLEKYATALFPIDSLRETFRRAGLQGRSCRISYGADGSTTIRLHGERVNDLSLLRGMTMYSLTLDDTLDVDLSPVRQVQGLKVVSIWGTTTTNLWPLEGLPLSSLTIGIWSNKVDVSVIKTMPIETLFLAYPEFTSNIDALRGMSTLRHISGETPARFWQRHDAKALHKTTETEQPLSPTLDNRLHRIPHPRRVRNPVRHDVVSGKGIK